MTARMTAGEAQWLIDMQGVNDPLEWSELEDRTRKRLDAKATRILSDAAAIRERMGEGWQPIGTAPRDGTAVAVFDANMETGCAVTVKWNHDTWCVVDCSGGILTDWDGNNYDVYPTHWRALPEPPR